MRGTALSVGSIASMVVCAVVAVAAGGRPAPSAVAGALPRHFRLVLTESFDRGRLHAAYYGRPGRDSEDAPLAVYSVRGKGNPRGQHSPESQPGDRATTVRGRSAILRTLNDESGPYARDLIWRERSRLVVAVEGWLSVSKRDLRRVAEHVRILGQPAWSRLYRQTSYAAQTGHPRKGMRRARVKRGFFDGHRWRLFALLPPHFPLSRDDLRAPCFELRFRKRRGHGDGCGFVPSWQRIRGSVFTFGAVPRRIKHVRIRPNSGHGFDLKVRTVFIGRGPRVRYFATPLPENACAVDITPAKHPHAQPAIAAPIRGRDQRRCARATTHATPPAGAR